MLTMRNWINYRRKRFWALMALVLYTLLGFFVAPRIIERSASATLAGVERTLSLRQVKVNPFVLSMEIAGADLRDTDGEQMLAWERLYVNFQLSSLFRWAWTFREISLDELALSEERFEGLDTRFTRLADAFAPKDPATTEPESGALPRLVIQDLNIGAARFALLDHAAGDYVVALGPIDIQIDDLQTLPDHEGSKSIKIQTPSGQSIEWRGTLQLAPLVSKGSIAITGAGFEEAFRYADYFLPFNAHMQDAVVRFDYDARLNPAGEPDVHVDNLELEANGTRIQRDGADTAWVALDRFALSGGTINLIEQSARFGSIKLSGLDVDAQLDQAGEINLLQLLPEIETDLEPGFSEEAGWTIELEEFGLSASTVKLTDEQPTLPASVTLQGIELTSHNLDNQPGSQFPVAARIELSSGGQLSLDGHWGFLPDLSAQGSLNLEQVELAVGQPYLAQVIHAQLGSGSLDLAGSFEFGPDQPGKFGGRLAVNELEIRDGVRDQRLAAWQSMTIERLDLDLAAETLNTSRVDLLGMYGRLHIAEDLSTNVSDLLISTPEGEAGTTPDLSIIVAGIDFGDSGLDFSDVSLPLPFRAEIRALNGEISALANRSSEPARVQLEGQVNEYGLARINGELNPWDVTDSADIQMTFRNLDMQRLTPYTVSFAGYPIEGGRLDMDLGYELVQRQLNGQNKIIVRELKLGEKSDHPDAGSLPLGLAVALLTDANGVIDLDVPVTGNLDDPEFKIGGVVWRALGNLITKAVTAPFRLLGALVGMDSEDFGQLEFTPGSAEISPPDQEKLAKLGEAMLQRPSLALQASGVYEPQADGLALQTQKFEAAQETRAGELTGSGQPAGTREVMESLASERLPELDLAGFALQFTAPPKEGTETPGVIDEVAYLAGLRERLIRSETTSEAELLALAGSRAAAVAERLNSAQPALSDRVKIQQSKAVEAVTEGLVILELEVITAGDGVANKP